MVKTALLLMTLRVFGSAGAESQLTPANESSLLNPNNIAQVPLQTNVADASAFFEATPDSKRWKARVKLRASSSDRASDTIAVGEAFVQLKAAPWLDVTAGRVIEKWGTGYGWTPTAFVGPARNPADPGDRRFANRGVDMLRADVFVRDTNVSLYALRDGRFAARVYRLIAGTDVSLVARSDDKVGLSLSRVFGEGLEVHGEVTGSQALAGAQVTVGKTNVVAEIFHGDETHAFLRVQRSFVEIIAIRNLRDGTDVVRITLSHKIRSRVEVYLIDTELEAFRVLNAGVRIYF